MTLNPATTEVARPRPKLRPYQLKCCKAIQNSFNRGKRKILASIPTGGGKTVTAMVFLMEMMRWYRKRGRKDRFLWIVHREELATQARKTWEKLAPDLSCSMWTADSKDADGDLVIAMVMSCRNLDGDFTIVVIDEAHHFAAASTEEDGGKKYDNSYTRLLKRIKWKYLLGLTATPTRLDGKTLDFEEVCFSESFLSLVRKGRLSRPVWIEVLTKQHYAMQVQGGDFTAKSLSRLDNKERNDKIADIWFRNRVDYGKTLIYVTGVNHCYSMMEALREKDPDVEIALVTGQATEEYRREVAEWFAEGPPSSQKIVINCFDKDTEILTPKGWVNGLDLQAGQEVYQVDKHGKAWPVTLTKERIIRRKTKPNERMVEVKSQQVDIRVTEDHRFLYSTQYRVAHEMEPVVSTAIEVAERNSPFQIRASVCGYGSHASTVEAITSDSRSRQITDDEVRFLAWALTDGHMGGERGVTISQARSSRFVDDIQTLLERLEYSFQRTSVDRESNLGTMRAYLWRIPKGNIGGQLARKGWHELNDFMDKDGWWIQYLNDHQFEILMEEMQKGDGIMDSRPRRRERKTFAICTVRRELADRIQARAVLAGWSCSISEQDNTNEMFPDAKTLLNVRLVKRTWIATNNQEFPAVSIVKPEKPEDVWCVSTDTGFVIVRRNGRACVQGQCMVYTEGFDEPSIKTVMLARSTMSRSLWMQMVGRGARIVDEYHEYDPATVKVVTEVGDDGVKIFELPDGTQFTGEDFGPKNGSNLHTYSVQTCNEFNLVNIMDDITKVATLCQEWQLEIRELPPEQMEEIRAREEMGKKILKIQEIKDQVAISDREMQALQDERVRDIIGILQISTYYHSNIGFPIDTERYNALVRLRAYARECYKTVEDTVWENGQPTRSDRWVFDSEKYEQAYSSCCLKGEFSFRDWEKIRYANYFKTIAGKQQVFNVITKRSAETWKYFPVIEMTSAARAEVLAKAKQDLEDAKKMNEEFNQEYDDDVKGEQLFQDVLNKYEDIIKHETDDKRRRASKRLMRVYGNLLAFGRAKDRRLNLILRRNLQGGREVGEVGRLRDALSSAMQEVVGDLSCLVVITPQAIRMDERDIPKDDEKDA